mgnify:FL=1
MSVSKTIVISCAGMGTRLGIGTTKCLVDIDGKPLIIRQLEQLKDFDDIRIVVGYQMERVMEVVNSYRKDILFVLNQNYRNTGTGGSFSLAMRHARELIVSLDGDLLVHPDDLARVLKSDEECVCGGIPCTEDPMLMKTLVQDGKIYGVGFSREEGEYEWTGLAQVRTARLTPGDHHVCDMMVPLLPLPMELIRTKEIDTMADYEHAVAWVKSGYAD